MNAYMTIMSPDDSPHEVYCVICPYVCTYVYMSAVRLRVCIPVVKTYPSIDPIAAPPI